MVGMATGFDPDSSVGEVRRLRGILDQLRNAAEKLGRRGRDLTLPVNWQSQGVYSAFAENGNACLKHRWTGQSTIFDGVVIPDGETPHYFIDRNWSEHRAMLNFTGPVKLSKLCISVLGLSLAHPLVAIASGGAPAKRRRMGSEGSGVAPLMALESFSVTPSPTKRRLSALEDGAVGSSDLSTRRGTSGATTNLDIDAHARSSSPTPSASTRGGPSVAAMGAAPDGPERGAKDDGCGEVGKQSDGVASPDLDAMGALSDEASFVPPPPGAMPCVRGAKLERIWGLRLVRSLGSYARSRERIPNTMRSSLGLLRVAS